MNSECFLKEDDLELAREMCKYIEGDSARNSAVANCLAVDIAKQILDEDDNIDFESGLYNINEIQEKFDMSDIYIKGSCVCVRYCIDNKIYIPKSHFEAGITPVAYMCVQPNEDFSGAILKGFLLAEKIDKNVEEGEFYVVNAEALESYYDVEPLLICEEEPLSQEFYLNAFDFIDKKEFDKEILFKTLTSNKSARIYLKDLSDSKKAFNCMTLTEFPKNSENILEETPSLNDELVLNDVENLDQNFLIEDSVEQEDSFSDDLLSVDEDNNLIVEDTEDNLLVEDDQGDNIELEEYSPEAALEANDEDFSKEMQEFGGEDLQIGTESDISEPLLTDDSEIAPLEEDISGMEINLQGDNLLDEVEENTAEIPSGNYETIVTPSLAYDDEANINENGIISDGDELADDPEQAYINEINDVSPVVEQDSSDEIKQNIEEVNEQSSIYEEVTDIPQETEEPEDENQIQELFDDNSEIKTVMEESVTPKYKKKNKLAPVLLLFIIVGLISGGYYGYQQYSNSDKKSANVAEQDKNEEVMEDVALQSPKEEAMPIETVEKVETPKPVEEGLNVSIPAIEKNLDASIMVSNLSINWEVPSNYITNSSAKRYFVKIGKIIQLNLKTELLLLNKMPITNKITLELTYNKSTGHFEIKDMPLKSGEQVIDDTIKSTVSNVLKMNLNINTSSFANTAGNPILVIHL